ncbi:MAG TPA: penicillin-binding transpeptidase domain-containing protein [Polyangia bacterium]|jgi:cell division protein FtsI/penicillin-binding protein 2|nr:penicillin-binding transpeptidase domain-containing protein [Polyangia bacterium]
MLRRPSARRHVALLLCITVVLLLALGQALRGRHAALAAGAIGGHSSASERGQGARARLRLEPAQIQVDARGAYVARRGEGQAPLPLTIDARVQRVAGEALARQNAPLGSVVVLGIEDGRVLALEGRRQAAPEAWAPELALGAWAPAASVFKVVTAAALVAQGVTPETRVCYHGGLRSVEATNLVPMPRLDTDCQTLAFGLAKSQNAILARLAHDHLYGRLDNSASALGAGLERTARALGFGAALPFELPTTASQVSLPAEPLPFAQVAAGFWQTSLSPLHGAYLAAVIARKGLDLPLHLAAEEPGEPGPEGQVSRVLDEHTAAAVGAMMVGTTRYGTARHGFHDRRGRAYLGDVEVAGKTGSLSGWQRIEDPQATASPTPTHPEDRLLAYSWFVGYAPADHPAVAIAVLLANDRPWRRRAHELAREVLAAYFTAPAAAKPEVWARR